ncbi:hypothetical protein TNIN_443341 [Trichonephila inaurata madagascariensis]|uniref:Uncharacterized protein n=1 Tax=Trichonephila inaurata madagascariensis TaxID=2747483 RepID=A0A8X6YC12_9ARAC|nr:hypothetical protein TNIN_443341 [Trichonephila inaurata madagascariensis]
MFREKNAASVVRRLEHHEVEVCLGSIPVSVSWKNGVIFMPWVTLPEVYTFDVLHSLLPGTPSCHYEATNRRVKVCGFFYLF